MSQLSLVILAAGMGSRYGGLKQIDPVGPHGEVVLDYSIFDALRSGFTEIVFVIRRDIEAVFREQVGRRFESKAAVRYVYQELNTLPAEYQAPAERTKPWGTGHAVWCAAQAVTHPFAVINADDFYGANSFQQLAAFLKSAPLGAHPAAGCMIGFQLDRTLSENGTVSRGICRANEHGRLTDVQEHTGIARSSDGISARNPQGAPLTLTGREIASMNCWGLTPATFAALEKHLRQFLEKHGRDLKAEFYLPAAITSMINAGEIVITVQPTRSDWFGVTYREDHPQVVAALRQLIDSGEYPSPLW